MFTCRWFAKCENEATLQVEHPTLGWVDICQAHVDWLGPSPSPTQFVPPLAAAVLDRRPSVKRLIGAEHRHSHQFDDEPLGPGRGPSTDKSGNLYPFMCRACEIETGDPYAWVPAESI